MPAAWTIEQKESYFNNLYQLYVTENKTIGEIAQILQWPEQTVYARLKRVGVKCTPELKPRYLNTQERTDIRIPKIRTSALSEFFGIMLGDGHLSHYQVTVTLGTKEMSYAEYVVLLMKKLFGPTPKIALSADNYKIVYLGSTALSRWLQKEGLVYNKVRAQVNVPRWIFTSQKFMQRFLRGFFDTDGSYYRLRWGSQIAFNNKSGPLLQSTRTMLLSLGYTASKVGNYKVYITKKQDVIKFFKEINPQNLKHQKRFESINRAGS